MNQWTNEPRQWNNESLKSPMKRWTPCIIEAMNQWTNEPVNQWIHECVNQGLHKPVNDGMDKLMDVWIMIGWMDEWAMPSLTHVFTQFFEPSFHWIFKHHVYIYIYTHTYIYIYTHIYIYIYIDICIKCISNVHTHTQLSKVIASGFFPWVSTLVISPLLPSSIKAEACNLLGRGLGRGRCGPNVGTGQSAAETDLGCDGPSLTEDAFGKPVGKQENGGLPSGKLLHNCGQSTFWLGKLTIFVAHKVARIHQAFFEFSASHLGVH